MAWTNPRTWIPGEFVTASMLNTHLRDNLNYLYGNALIASYTATLADVANTTTETAIITFTVPANAWADGELIRILFTYPVSYTHLRAHETPEHLVCRLLLEKKKT